MSESPEREGGPLDSIRWIGWVQRQAAEDWIRARDLTVEQGFTLSYLSEHPGVIQKELAGMSRTTAASTSSLLQGLERRGLIERRADTANGRVKRIFPTDEGRNIVAGFGEAMAEANERILAPLTPKERDSFAAITKKITDQLPTPVR